MADEFLNVHFRVRHVPSANQSRVSVIVDNTWKTKRGNVDGYRATPKAWPWLPRPSPETGQGLD